MPAHKASPIELSAEHERELNQLVRAHSTPQKLAERARIILLAAIGLGIAETAQHLGIWRKTAAHWRSRWRDAANADGVAARLSDAPRCGAPAKFTPEAICQIMALACQDPEALTCQSVIGVKANWPDNLSPAASLTASRTARSGAF